MPECAIPNQRLWVEMPGEIARAHRVVPVGPSHHATIDGKCVRAILVRKLDSAGAGTILVPCSELTDPAPLTAAEAAEYDRLDGLLAGTIGERRKLHAFMKLFLRRQMFGGAELPA